MLAFLTKETELKKRYDIVYIFNNQSLYNKLNKKFNCVNLARNGMIKEMNFKKETNLALYQIVDIQKAVYFYLKKRNPVYTKKDINMKMLYEMEKKNNYEGAVLFMKDTNFQMLNEIFSINIESEFLKKYNKYIPMLYNYINSFYIGFSNKFFYDKRVEVLKFGLFVNAMLYYRFDKYDLTETGFKRGYLKVLSRLFVEQIHKKELLWL